jgi:hypothetical protein
MMKKKSIVVLLILLLPLFLNVIPMTNDVVTASNNSWGWEYVEASTYWSVVFPASGSWQTYNVSALIGSDVSGMVLDCFLGNDGATSSCEVGVRTAGSSLNRRVRIDEGNNAGGNTENHASMQVLVGESSGN